MKKIRGGRSSVQFQTSSLSRIATSKNIRQLSI